jgi:hypothetical protein
MLAEMGAGVPTIAASVEELLAGADRREPFANPDGRSTARFERVWIGGEPHVVKYVHVDDDYTMRASGDIGCRPVRAWAAGLLDAAPHIVDHAVVGAATGCGRNGWGAALLMRDVSADLAANDDTPFAPDEHERFVGALAGWCASTWGYRDAIGLLRYEDRWGWFGHAQLAAERAHAKPERVAGIATAGWQRFDREAPRRLATVIDDLRHDTTPLADALRATPSCLLHGDPKASNMGTAADGRTVMIDWAYVGEGPACHELGWYLALNRQKLPTTKEATIDAFRAGLERHGVDTADWWARQLGLALLGTVVQFGWEKALGDRDELAWWCDAALEGCRWL